MFFTDPVSGKISFRCNPSPHRPERLFSTTLSPAPEATEVQDNESILKAAKKNKVRLDKTEATLWNGVNNKKSNKKLE